MSPYRENAKPEDEPTVKKKREPSWKIPAAMATACVVGVVWLACWDAPRWGFGVTLLISAGWLIGTAIYRADEQVNCEKVAKKRLQSLIELKPPERGFWPQYYVMEEAADWIEKHK